MASSEQLQDAQPRLGLFDAVSIILGIIIGAGIYRTPTEIFTMMDDPWITLGLWTVCGLLALIGALCYAELATAYPRSGGDYVYITRAYGPVCGYLFGWAQLAVIQTGSIGLMAYIFAEYAARFLKIMDVNFDLNFEIMGRELEFNPEVIFASGAVVVITLLNLLGVVLGKIAQNLLTLAKVVGLGGIIVAGFAYADNDFVVDMGVVKEVKASSKKIVVELDSGSKSFTYGDKTKFVVKGFDSYNDKTYRTETTKAKDDEGNEIEVKKRIASPVTANNFKPELDKDKNLQEKTVKVLTRPGKPTEAIQVMSASYPTKTLFPDGPPLAPRDIISLALVFVFVTYGGWNDAAFVAAEVRNPGRNIPRALFIGTAGVTLIYMAVNYAYIHGLGFERAQVSTHIAADMLGLLPGDFGEKGMCILVMISALGAVNGLVYTSSRIYSTLGKDYSLFAPLGRWNRTLGTPIWSLLLQMLISVAMVLSVGTPEGQYVLDRIVDFVLGTFLGMGSENHLDWTGESGFRSLLRCTAPIFWIFFLMTALSLFILRINDPRIARPFRVPLFPILPLIFVATCGYMLYSGLIFAGKFGLVGALLVAAGLPFYVFSRRSINTETHGSL